MAVSDREKDGSTRSPGRRALVLTEQAAGMKRKINPSFPESQTIARLKRSCNHQRLRQSGGQRKNPPASSLGGGKTGIPDLAMWRSNPL